MVAVALIGATAARADQLRRIEDAVGEWFTLTKMDGDWLRVDASGLVRYEPASGCMTPIIPASLHQAEVVGDALVLTPVIDHHGFLVERLFLFSIGDHRYLIPEGLPCGRFARPFGSRDWVGFRKGPRGDLDHDEEAPLDPDPSRYHCSTSPEGMLMREVAVEVPRPAAEPTPGGTDAPSSSTNADSESN